MGFPYTFPFFFRGPTLVGGGSVAIASSLNKLIYKRVGGGFPYPFPIIFGGVQIRGSSTKKTFKLVGTASMTITGTLQTIKTISQIVGSGLMTITGLLVKKTCKAVGGATMSPLPLFPYTFPFDFAIGISGALSKKTFKTVGGGTVSIAGFLFKLRNWLVGGGSVAIVGNLSKKIYKTVGDGAITIIGSISAYTLVAIMLTLNIRNLALKLRHREFWRR